MVLDRDGVARELQNFGVGQAEAPALGFRNAHVLRTAAIGGINHA
jgi:hypothetical protein